MSYYTYFYPQSERYNPNNLTNDQLNDSISENRIALHDSQIKFIVELIDIYYTKTPISLNSARYFWNVVISYYKRISETKNILWINSELKESSSVAINHAECEFKTDLEDRLKSIDDSLENCFREAIVVASIKPFYDKDKFYISEYNEQEVVYLSTDFPNRIDIVFTEVESLVSEYTRTKFMLDNFDTKKEESEFGSNEKTSDKDK